MALSTPIIVVGSGLAGLSAAAQLLAHQLPVRLLDRAAKPGGNSIKASSGINAAPTRFQPSFGDNESGLDDAFLADTVLSAGLPLANATGDERTRRDTLITTLTESSSSALYWLTDTIGVDLSTVAQLGGHSHPRTHRGPGKPPGAAIVSTLLERLNADPLFTLQTGATVTRVKREADEVMGVEYTVDNGADSEPKTETLNGPLVFAAGGFAGDSHGLLAKYRPDLAGLPSTNEARPGALPLLQEIGAGVLDLDRVQVHPTGFIDPTDRTARGKILAAEMLRGEGGILLLNGSRFVNELQTREYISNQIMATPATENDSDDATKQWDVTLVMDEGTAAATASHMGFYKWKGLMRAVKAEDLDATTQDSIQTYADVVAGVLADPHGRTAHGHWTLRQLTPDTTLYVGSVTPVVHFTMGGVAIDDHAAVLDAAGTPIHGLWAAGEITGGIHGQNRLGGSSLLECVVFGRRAGDAAAEFYRLHYLGESI
ncbi:hypothetical protein ASPZODRAFT_76469 [Penicilliopsis zonata CBS 506.65]|uniref:Fumarate reductase n=1 Tax=Penicilliopsis zonata CBS 506.65 TaxID=1073090 RepID=A0A1L9S651_9EURO|nr:hypothetical protein ASPZODRAFT_76469 [Penicilliopsis zonata CBS 506.65]OJJ42603.1 hypothetical protein ASPZODRAFT_76469 [Penicilliopsis zonata CBS 506.65]